MLINQYYYLWWLANSEITLYVSWENEMKNSKTIDTYRSHWLKADARKRKYAQELDTEDLADSELENQLNLIKDIATVRSDSFEDVLVKLKLWKEALFPEGTDIQEINPEHVLAFSAMQDIDVLLRCETELESIGSMVRAA